LGIKQEEFTTPSSCGILSHRSMKKIIQLGSIILILILGFLAYQYILPNIRPPRGFLKIQTTPAAEIILNGESLGNSPMQKRNLPIGNYDLVIKANVAIMPDDSNNNAGSKSVELREDIELEASAVTAVKYELAPDEIFNSGEVLGLRDGAGISIVTRPENSEVFIDGESKGSAPFSQVIAPGVHTLKVSEDGYITREIGVNIEEGFRLTASITLALNPYPQIKKLDNEGKLTLYDLSSNNSELNSNFNRWAEAIWHFQTTGQSVSQKFDVLIDETGNTHTLVADYSKNKEINVGYLSGNLGKLSNKAKDAWEGLTKGKSKGEASAQVLILKTPNGFLNVRSGPSTNSLVIAKVLPGKTFALLKEEGDWFQIIYKSSKTGWISSQYANKK